MVTIDVNGVALAADERGDGEAVVYVCGTGQPATMWDMVGRLEVDAAGFRTIAYDNRGVPPSAIPPPPYAMQDLVDDAIAVIEYFDVAPCHLIGASLGANIVVSVARQRPDLLASTVLLIGGGRFRPGMAERFADRLAQYRQGGEAARSAQRDDLFESMLTEANVDDNDARAAVAPIVDTLANASDDWSGAIGQLAANLEWAQRDHLEEAAEVVVPTLMIANGADAFFDPDDLRATAEQMAHCTFVENPGLPHVSIDASVLAADTQRTIEFLNEHRRA